MTKQECNYSFDKTVIDNWEKDSLNYEKQINDLNHFINYYEECFTFSNINNETKAVNNFN